jgi:MoaA/NifB/PqqE/SkfB family radical SAM enzyme
MRKEIYTHCLKEIIKRPPSLKVFINYFQFKLNYFFKRITLNNAPVSLVVYANKLCNYKCEFCFTYGTLNNEQSSQYNLDVAQLRKILNSDWGQKSLRVGLLGGEPFLNKDIFELIEELYQHRKISTVVTNASLLTDEKIQRLIKSNLTVLGISLYDNNWEHVKRVSTAYSAAKKVYWVQTVVDSNSIKKMEKIIQFAIESKISNLLFANYQPYYTGNSDFVIYTDNQEYSKEEERLKNLYSDKISISWVPVVSRKIGQKKTCTMPFSYVHVDAKGALGGCCFREPNEEKYGNIFSDSWNKKYYQDLRANMFNPNIKGLDECEKCENLSCDLYKV